MADKIVEGKRNKLLQKARQKRKIDNNDELVPEPEPIIDGERELVINQEITNIKPITRSVKFVGLNNVLHFLLFINIQGHASDTNLHRGSMDG